MACVELVVDAANVIGSRPDGWWRDRPGAAARLVSALAAALRSGALTGPVVVVLEGAARAGAPAGEFPVAVDGAGPAAGGPADSAAGGPALRVVHASRDGDSAIVDEVSALVAAGGSPTVVTADRGLRDRVLAAGGAVVGPTWLLDRL